MDELSTKFKKICGDQTHIVMYPEDKDRLGTLSNHYRCSGSSLIRRLLLDAEQKLRDPIVIEPWQSESIVALGTSIYFELKSQGVFSAARFRQAMGQRYSMNRSQSKRLLAVVLSKQLEVDKHG